MTLVVLDEAELEFQKAVNYYEEAAGLGTRFRDEVSAGVAWILDNPRVLRLRPGNYYRLNLRVKRFNLPEKSDLNNGINANPPQNVLAEVVPSRWGDLAMELG